MRWENAKLLFLRAIIGSIQATLALGTWHYRAIELVHPAGLESSRRSTVLASIAKGECQLAMRYTHLEMRTKNPVVKSNYAGEVHVVRV